METEKSDEKYDDFDEESEYSDESDDKTECSEWKLTQKPDEHQEKVITAFNPAFAGLDREYITLLKGRNAPHLLKVLSGIYDSVEGDVSLITPPISKMFSAFRDCPWKNAKVVIIGQDPYPKAGNADGKAFSVPRGVTIPSSLRKIFECLNSREGLPKGKYSGDLRKWAEQGVLLLNTALTTIVGKIEAHMKLWQSYTDDLISAIAQMAAGEQRHLVFILWGKKAQDKSKIIDNVNAISDVKHIYLKWGHPSSSNRANGDTNNKNNFIHCTNFSECNEALKKWNYSEIDWTRLEKA